MLLGRSPCGRRRACRLSRLSGVRRRVRRGRLGLRRGRPAGRLGRRRVRRGGISGRLRGFRLVDHAEHLAHFHILAILPIDAAEDASLRRADLEIDLVRFELHERIPGGHDVPFLAQPVGTARIDDRLTDFRHDNVGWHQTLKTCCTAHLVSWASARAFWATSPRGMPNAWFTSACWFSA